MIEVSRVSKRFGKVAALRDVSCRIEPGERVAFVGSNGSGKTTLLRSLAGLLRFEGRISIAGFNVAEAPERALRHLAYIPQVAPPLEASVAEVILAHARLRQIERSAIDLRAEQLGLSLREVDDVRFRDLSGGMRQKLLAAMALASDTSVLVCDEPTANLDAAARAAFFTQLAALPRERVVILCSHRAEEVDRFVERVLQFADGRLVQDSRSKATEPVSASAGLPRALRVEELAS